MGAARTDPPGQIKSTIDALEALERTIHDSLSVYRWWRPDMNLPAVWNWLTPSDVALEGAPPCRTVDTLRITVSIGVDPTAVMGEGDMLELEVYADLLIDVVNAELGTRYPFGQREATRRGVQTVADELGAASILVLELPLEVKLHRPVLPAP